MAQSTGKATAGSASINLLNTIIGAGMLAMPYGIKSNGVLLGIFVVILSGASSSFGLYLQTKCTRYVPVGHASFFALSQLTYPSLSVIFDLAIAVKCLGVGISYLVVVGDLMPKIAKSLIDDTYLEGHGILLERNFWISLFMVIVVPLSFLKRLDSLRYASMVALSSVAYLAVLVVVHFFKKDIVEKGPVNYFVPHSVSSALGSFPIFVFAYTCHQNMFSLVNELEDKSSRNMNRVISYAIGIAMTLYVIVGVSGYLTFGDLVGGNIIVSYPESFSSTFGRVAIACLVVLSYPLQCHPCRASVNNILHYFDILLGGEDETSKVAAAEEQRLVGSGDDQSSTANEQVIVALTKRNHLIITSFVLLISYLVAISVRSLEHVLAFVGSTGSTSISFILPGIFGYKMIGADKIANNEPLTKKEKLQKYGGFALAIWGFIVMIVCLSATIFLGAKG
ncbi:hypothetical protein BABINDRAFT_57640 [Babjeviella inositovora NRRL Y-12698]|uniref:Amino acid transporter transmembrane domain-containing protein n=1 Tax=Babjeviella inositovora NRRL Y-12698 TaxID=984486 RepID=A0A1E3R1K4_9ASCO|nr:uncharacterized protein BABINDRAFT_57640 [Babjeviella inositovora NRRL Y-12698]ODQ83242.1 hypothetical protein BABINDRAFT_57640 [Babjeviella inositovora NRRL Y-12698]